MKIKTNLLFNFHRRYSIHKQSTTFVILLINRNQVTSLKSNDEQVPYGFEFHRNIGKYNLLKYTLLSGQKRQDQQDRYQ